MSTPSKDIQTDLIATVRGLFQRGEIDLVIGYENGSLPFGSRPAFVRGEAEAEALVWNRACGHNLTAYLPKLFREHARTKNARPMKVGIVLKGCDSRSLNVLIQEKQVARENVVALGIGCRGVVDTRKMASILHGAEIAEVADASDDDSLSVTDHAGRSHEVKVGEVLRDSCLQCRHRTPVVYDHLFGDAVEGEKTDTYYSAVSAVEELPSAERWQHFVSEMSKCIRCNACRQVCPNCYCTECFALQTRPAWVTPAAELSDIAMFHVGRLLHQAGRCTDCGACVAACPADIDLRSFGLKILKDVEAFFGVEAGLSAEVAPVMSSFREDDDQSFITEP
jgi:ferredoxin